MNSSFDYRCVARDYARHRNALAHVLAELHQHSRIASDSLLLEAGCGTGAHLAVLTERTCSRGLGLEPSPAMLANANRDANRVRFVVGEAERIPIAAGRVDLVFSVNAVHHFEDPGAYFRDAARVLRRGGRVCTFTDSESIIRRRDPLSRYWPESAEADVARYPAIGRLRDLMQDAGLEMVRERVVSGCFEVSDSGPYRDKVYSCLHLVSEQAFTRGLQRMESDLASGPLHGTSELLALWGRLP